MDRTAAPNPRAAVRRCVATTAIAASVALVRVASATDWPQVGFDARHSGNNTSESAIGRDTVGFLVLDYRVPLMIPSISDSAPVYAAGISTPDGTKNLLFFNATDSAYDGASTTASVIAVDAATGLIVWVRTTRGSAAHASSSPALDPGREYVYAAGLDGYVHKYGIGDGVEATTPGPAGWPQLVTLKPYVEKIASGLTIARSRDSTYLVAVTNGYNGDGGDYQGHVTSIDLATGTQNVFNAMCSNLTQHLAEGTCADVRSGIWGRGGATYDPVTDRLYAATGNGHFDANRFGYNWGDSLVALAPDASSSNGRPLDSFTPAEYQDLDDFDEDLGSNSLAILPAPAGSAVPHLGLQFGKDRTGYLLDLDDLSGLGAPGRVGGELQRISFAGPFDMSLQPAVWVDPEDGSTWVFVGGVGWQLALDGTGMPSLVQRWIATPGFTSPVVANGLLFSADNGLAQALDPRTGETLWAVGGYVGVTHWQSPIVVDGALYATDSDGFLMRFVPRSHVVTPAVNDAREGSIDPSDPQTVADGGQVKFVVTAFAPYVIDYVFGCGVTGDSGHYVTGQIFEDCTVTAAFMVDPAELIFRDGFDQGAR